MQKSTMRIEDACIWRKALAEHPDETMMILIQGLRLIAKNPGRLCSVVAADTLERAGFESGFRSQIKDELDFQDLSLSSRRKK